LNIHLSQQSGIPVYLQIVQQIQQLISSERLNVNQELEPIRVLAEKLVINPNTVARAYRELELAGWIYKKRGAGTFVSTHALEVAKTNFQQELLQKAQNLVAEANRMNVTKQQLINMIKDLD